MKYAIVCNLNGEVVEYHKKLVREVAEKFGVILPIKQKFEPHFTLKYGFEAANIKEVEATIENFCAKYKKTFFKVGGFDSFRKDIIFIKVKLSNEAYQVFMDFIAELKKISWMTWRESEGGQLNFHSTVAADCEKKYNEILDFIKGREKIFDCWFDNVTILQEGALIDGVITWKVYKIFKIKQGLFYE